MVPSYVYLPRSNPAWLPVLPTSIALDPYADVPFRLPASVKPDSLDLSVKVGSSSGNVDVLAYNVRRGAWDRLGGLGSSSGGQTTNFVASIPNPADYTGPAGDVTLRLLSTTGKADLGLRSIDLGLNQGSGARGISLAGGDQGLLTTLNP
jgi:hypothetical protein